ncbi:MAG TPA: tRNA pseudouridine(55) synthase TruB [Thermoanaerobaculia bacterium]|nr:tRNA pseudouridine(55) synthase TruB [Thermoanaerobaculia bacterium]
MKDGLLLIDKEAGCTSHDVVQKARRILGQKKIGHCGTLDPDATGLLLLTVGAATRLTRFLIRAPKLYSGVIRFGVATDTYDASGTVTAEQPIDGLTEEAIREGMERFVGSSEQQPPPYSAKKVGGVKFYELARRGEEVPAETKEVTVFELAPTGPLADGAIPFRLGCSSGTYARTLAHDLGRALGCGAHLSALRRTKIGPFLIEDAVTIPQLAGLAGPAGGTAGKAWLPFDEIPLPFAEVLADAQQEQRIRHGQTVLVRELAGEEGDWVKLMNRRHEMIAVGTVVERIGGAGVGIVQPRVVFE